MKNKGIINTLPGKHKHHKTVFVPEEPQSWPDQSLVAYVQFREDIA